MLGEVIVTLLDIVRFFSESNELLGLSFSGVFSVGVLCFNFVVFKSVNKFSSQFCESWGVIFWFSLYSLGGFGLAVLALFLIPRYLQFVREYSH